jgi:hypothetical protein
LLPPDAFRNRREIEHGRVLPDPSQSGFPSLLSPPLFPEMTQTRISGRLPQLTSIIGLRGIPRCPTNAAALPPFALCAFPGAAARRWWRTEGS